MSRDREPSGRDDAANDAAMLLFLILVVGLVLLAIFKPWGLM